MRHLISIIIMCCLSVYAHGQVVTNKVDFVAKTELDHFQQLVELKFSTNEENLKKQALEYERRLGELNHEAEQLKDMRSSLVSRELFDATVKEMTAKIDRMRDTINIAIGIGMALQIALVFWLRSQKIVQVP